MSSKSAAARLVATFVLVSIVDAPLSAHAASEKVLYSFVGGNTDGCYPVSPVIIGGNGNLYGTTESCGGKGNGTVYQLPPSGDESLIYAFTPSGDPSGLIQDSSGKVFGTANLGPKFTPSVFRLSLKGKLKSLAMLPKTGGGAVSGVIADSAGDLFGLMTSAIYEIPAAGKLKTLHVFKSGTSDGFGGDGNLLLDAKGNLFGVTNFGGASNEGTIFEFSSAGVETVLYSFSGGVGDYPEGPLTEDSAGNLYGVTRGTAPKTPGTAFMPSPAGTMTVLHVFSNVKGSKDAVMPNGGLVMDSQGNLYGTSSGGGQGAGTVFEIAKSGAESVVYSFTDKNNDGREPMAPIIIDSDGNLFGTTMVGGAADYGTVFEIAP